MFSCLIFFSCSSSNSEESLELTQLDKLETREDSEHPELSLLDRANLAINSKSLENTGLEELEIYSIEGENFVDWRNDEVPGSYYVSAILNDEFIYMYPELHYGPQPEPEPICCGVNLIGYDQTDGNHDIVVFGRTYGMNQEVGNGNRFLMTFTLNGEFHSAFGGPAGTERCLAQFVHPGEEGGDPPPTTYGYSTNRFVYARLPVGFFDDAPDQNLIFECGFEVEWCFGYEGNGFGFDFKPVCCDSRSYQWGICQ